MTQQKNLSEASLLYMVNGAPLDAVDTLALRSTIETLGHPVREVRAEAGEFVLLICDAMQILVAGSDVPFPMEHFRSAARPVSGAEVHAEALSLVARHRSSLTVLVMDRDQQTNSALLKQQIIRETVDLLLSATEADLVFWSQDDQLMTAAEAEVMLEGPNSGSRRENWMADAGRAPKDGIVQPRRAENAGRPKTRRPRRWVAAAQHSAMVFDAETKAQRPCEVHPQRPSRLPALHRRPAHLCVAPQLSAQARDWFEGPVTPATVPKPSENMAILRAFLALDNSSEPKRLAETASGRAALYLMSATIGVFSLPVGASMLTYNALSGGSFRATSHVMALTGIGLALTGLGFPNPASALGF